MTEAVETPEVEATPEPEAKGLRAQLETALAENRELKADKRVDAFRDAGLDTETGLGKAIAKEYEGELNAEAVQAYATAEYGWEAPAESQHPQAQELEQAQQRVDEIGQTAGSVAPPSGDDVLAKAEAEGDTATTMAIKGQQLAGMMNRR